MWFWICAAALAAAAALAVSARAAAASRRAAAGSEVDADLGMHRRQLDELDELARRELIAPEDLASTRTEAARRLLAAADRAPPAERAGGAASRRIAVGAAAAAGVVALALYLTLGRPGLADAPYAERLGGWRAADPNTLPPAPLAAVLASLAASRPGDPRVWGYLGRAELAAGRPGPAADAFVHAARLDPHDADDLAAAGQALALGGEGRIPPEAQLDFRAALARDPRNAAARYFLARARIAAGDAAGGIADWRELATELPRGDLRRLRLEAEIAAATTPPPSGGPDAAAVRAMAQSLPTDAASRGAFIRGMVSRLAARLAAHPDDPQGWARLVRAEGVLGDAPAREAALRAGRRALADRPEALAALDEQARASSPVGEGGREADGASRSRSAPDP